MKNKKNILLSIIVGIVSLLIVLCVFYILLDNSGKVNKGSFRVNDAVVTSVVTVEEKQEDKQESMMSDLILDLSEVSTISILIPKDSEINELYIDNININLPNKYENMYLTQPNSEEKKELVEGENGTFNLTAQDKGEQYLVEIEIVNSNFAKDVKIPVDTKVVRFDGTLLSLTGMNVEDIIYNISFDLNISNKQGKTSVCSLKYKIPDYDIASFGMSVTHCNLNDYIFTLKDNFMYKIKKHLKF